MLSRNSSERTLQFSHCPFADYAHQVFAPSLQWPRAAPHTALFCSSQRGCTNALEFFCSLQPPPVHNSSRNQSPELVNVQMPFPPKGGRAAIAVLRWEGNPYHATHPSSKTPSHLLSKALVDFLKSPEVTNHFYTLLEK